ISLVYLEGSISPSRVKAFLQKYYFICKPFDTISSVANFFFNEGVAKVLQKTTTTKCKVCKPA
ncbi:hypothetical protein, partial [Mediterraneibacter faecis]|uniref:hypothetical protein n=1 Tax=Mediterraneibacter faecis TaxID=592978 RepID=UPI0022DFA5CD